MRNVYQLDIRVFNLQKYQLSWLPGMKQAGSYSSGIWCLRNVNVHTFHSTQLTWALFALAQHPKIQDRLRDELLGVPTDTPTMDELQALPYLDAVLREVLRLHPAVPLTSRRAAKDDVIPLAVPIIDRHGQKTSEVR